jgi:hypothetical protein
MKKEYKKKVKAVKPSPMFLKVTEDICQRKHEDTNIYAFLKAVPELKALSQQGIYMLSERFNINPDTFAFLINITANGVVFYYEN